MLLSVLFFSALTNLYNIYTKTTYRAHFLAIIRGLTGQLPQGLLAVNVQVTAHATTNNTVTSGAVSPSAGCSL